MIRILLVDDQKTVIEALKISLEPEQDLQIVGTADNGISAIEQVEALQPDIVVMNMEMPILDGASATKRITSQFVNTKVLILTSYDSDEYITKSLAMGARGYLLKNTDSQDIAGAIRNVHKGYTQISPGLLEKLLVYTDSGIILSKLKNPVTAPQQGGISTRQVMGKSQKTASTLQLAYRQQQKEIVKLRQSLNENQQELPKIRRNLANNSKSVWMIAILGLLSIAAISLFLLKLYNKTNTIQAKAESIQINIIPMERVGLYGEFSLSGLAERVAKSYKNDSSLADISTVYVAQEDDAIVLKGKIPNAALLSKMENLAKQVPGVNKVYTSQVSIQQVSGENVLGSQAMDFLLESTISIKNE
ncbi:response regulator [Pleurocapsa sp. FMAR1]|uniref:response regulator n=1 Tax=Pleurocapsa sp. FMAR1 TaxID=3040204 RepID=UPI0029C68600|nr:response regulator [Pleurocapsa sp. FMAR1]